MSMQAQQAEQRGLEGTPASFSTLLQGDSVTHPEAPGSSGLWHAGQQLSHTFKSLPPCGILDEPVQAMRTSVEMQETHVPKEGTIKCLEASASSGSPVTDGCGDKSVFPWGFGTQPDGNDPASRSASISWAGSPNPAGIGRLERSRHAGAWCPPFWLGSQTASGCAVRGRVAARGEGTQRASRGRFSRLCTRRPDFG